MSINLVVVNKIKNKHLLNLIQSYLVRINWKVNIIEIEAKTKDPSKVKIDEAEQILRKLATISNHTVITFDERGKTPDSMEFSEIISESLNQGKKICFIIGGAEGLTEEVRKKSDHIISFGKMTIPHALARLLLVEQIYRSWTIYNGKSYHK